MSTSISLISSSSSSSLFCFNAAKPAPHPHLRFFKVRASVDHNTPRATTTIVHSLKHCAKAAIIVAAASAAVLRPTHFPAWAETPAAVVEQAEEEQDSDLESSSSSSSSPAAPLSELLESNSEAVEALKTLLQEKLNGGEDSEALKILQRLAAAQPAESQWKFMTARVLAETGDIDSARQMFEEILAADPLSFEALFENALLMDRSGEGEAVIARLEAALRVAEEENKAKEARDVRLLIAQVRFLQKDVDGALGIYEELSKEDPRDFRPYFCRGMIYSLTDRNAEAREQFAKYRELSPKKFEVEGFVRTPLSRMKLFGTDDN